MTHTNCPASPPAPRAVGHRLRGPLLLLPLLGIFSVMALPAPPPAATPDQRFDARLQAPRFAPWWRVQMRQAYGAVCRRRALLESHRASPDALGRRQVLVVAISDYNQIASQAPPEAFQGQDFPRSLTWADTNPHHSADPGALQQGAAPAPAPPLAAGE